MTFIIKIVYSFTLVFYLNITLAQNSGKDTSIFFHISYAGGPAGSDQHTLFWYTEREMANTYFVIEHFCWNRWVKRGKVSAIGRPGTGDYVGKEAGKYQYKFDITRHSGNNKMRVLLMNDSNVCLAISKELSGMKSIRPKASYNIRKKEKEILFSYETYFEIYDANNTLVKKGFDKALPYHDLPEGIYTLYYDDSTTSFKIK